MPLPWPWLQKPPGGPAAGVAAGEHLWPRWSAWIGHSHVYASQPFPGAPAYAYEGLGLAEFTPIGAGTVNRDQMRYLYPTAFAAPGYLTQGLGGLIQGQYASAPLVVTTQMQPDTSALLDLELFDLSDNWIG